MSFSFGFTADSDDEFVGDAHAVETKPFINPLDVTAPQARAPLQEDFEEMLKSLKNVRVTFEKYTTPKGNVVYRRELFDVKHQLMMEEKQDEDDDEFKILIGDDATDLKKNVYEGGLKSWECSVDTVEKLSEMNDEQVLNGDVVELGCGTALPSTYLFNRSLTQSGRTEDITFILSDYNSSVLRLVTLPNLIITWACAMLSEDENVALQRWDDETIPIVEDELQLTEELLSRFYQSMSTHKINLKLLSGAWSRQFVQLVETCSSKLNLIITSETIYSPETLPVVGELVIELLQKSSGALAMVAAKDIYFGVGGSLVEFEQYLEQRQGQGVSIAFEVQKVNAGLKRSIVLIN